MTHRFMPWLETRLLCCGYLRGTATRSRFPRHAADVRDITHAGVTRGVLNLDEVVVPLAADTPRPSSTVSEPFFLALAHRAADLAAADGPALRVGAGVLRPHAGGAWDLHTFRVHATEHTLVLTTQHAPLRYHSLDSDTHQDTEPVLSDTEVLLLPAMQRATLLDTVTVPSDSLTEQLGAAVQTTLDALGATGPLTSLALVRVAMAALPAGMPFDAHLDVVPDPLPYGSDMSWVTVLWPLSLCWAADYAPSAWTAGDAWADYNAEALLSSASWPAALPVSPASLPAYMPVLGIGAPPPVSLSCVPSPTEDDVFQGIGQLTEDDLNFFGATPGPSAMADGPELSMPPSVSDASPGTRTRSTTGVSESSTDGFGATPAAHDGQTLVPPRTLPASSPAAQPDELEQPLSRKYEVHGKFFAVAAQRRKREDEAGRAMLSRVLVATPGSAATSSSAPASPWNGADDDSDDDVSLDTTGLVRALLLSRLHAGVAAPRTDDAATEHDAHAEAMHLQWTAQYGGAARRHTTPAHAHAPQNQQSASVYPSHTPSEVHVLTGCGDALVGLDARALLYQRALGLVPLSGQLTACAHVVLVDVPTAPGVVEAWRARLMDTYASLSLGTMTRGGVYIHSAGLWQGAAPGGADWSADTTHLVYLVYQDPAACRRVYSAWPLSGARTSLLAVPLTHVRPIHPLEPLARASYEAGGRRVALVAPCTYEGCTHLRERVRFVAAWPVPRSDPLHQTLTLHAAYERRHGVTRVVITDERAYHVECHAWSSGAAASDADEILRLLRARASRTRATWHVVVCRWGGMPRDEAHAWAQALRGAHDEGIVSCLVVVSMEAGVGMDVALDTPTPGPRVVYVDDLATSAAQPVLAHRSAMVFYDAGNGTRGDPCGWALHLIHVVGGAEGEAGSFLADVVVHMVALCAVTILRWPSPPPLWPWHIAVLACA